MSLSIIDYLKVTPPFQHALAQTGHAPIRQVCKDFKETFDSGLCQVWTNLKIKSSKDFKILSIFMDKIEKDNGGQPTKQNSLLFFQKLTDGVTKGEIKTVVRMNPTVKFPLNMDCFQLFGPKYVENAIPKEIQEKANEIARLRTIFEDLDNTPDVPAKFECKVLNQIMAIPIFDGSHKYIQDLWHKISINTLTQINNPGFRDVFHIIDTKSLEMIKEMSSIFGCRCPVCRHSSQQDHIVIDSILQDEILQFLQKNVDQRS